MIQKACKIFFKSVAALGLFIGLQQLVELKTRGFYLQKIQADDLPFQARWETAPLSLEEEEHIQKLLSQSYRLIGAGSECFAFLSEDGQAVIKFFKLDHVRPVYLQRGLFEEDHSALAGTLSDHPLTRTTLPPFFNRGLKRTLGIREFRIQRTFSSTKLAYDNLKEETGLLYLHLNPTQHLHKSLKVYDACGICHQIDLDQAKFFLQKRAVPLESHFTSLKSTQDHKRAQASIDSLLALLLNRCKKGFADRDLFNKNLGYIGTEAIEIDTGSFLKSPRMREPWVYKQEIFYATLELKSWLKKNYPDMVSYLEERVSQEIISGK